MNNLFLSGKPGAGKTTIIKKAIRTLSLQPAGFMTISRGENEYWKELYLTPARDFIYGTEDEVKNKKLLAWRQNRNSLIRLNRRVFNEYAVGLLSIKEDYDLIIMDELGRFELKAEIFRKKVISVLEALIPVLGVVKQEENPFLNRIRNRNDTEIILVKEENRDNIYEMVVNGLRTLFIDK